MFFSSKRVDYLSGKSGVLEAACSKSHEAASPFLRVPVHNSCDKMNSFRFLFVCICVLFVCAITLSAPSPSPANFAGSSTSQGGNESDTGDEPGTERNEATSSEVGERSVRTVLAVLS